MTSSYNKHRHIAGRVLVPISHEQSMSLQLISGVSAAQMLCSPGKGSNLDDATLIKAPVSNQVVLLCSICTKADFELFFVVV